MNLDELTSGTHAAGRNYALVHERCDWAEVLSAFGELDISIAGEFQSAITRHINGDLPLIIDLAFCEYLDSTILRVLVRSYRTAPHRFAIVVPDKAHIARIFEMTRLDRTLGVAHTREELRERFAA